MSRAGIEELYKLSAIIQDSIKKIDAALTDKALDFPLLDAPFSPPSEAGRALPAVANATTAIAAAASQLRATVYPPPLTVANTAMLFNLSAAMRVVVETHAAEVVSTGGPQGLHVKDIAAPSGVDPAKLARILRVLATYNIFREVSPDVFTHNRLSSLLDTRKPLDAILKDPKDKHSGTMGLAAAIAHVTDDAMKSASYLSEALLDPVSGHANDFRDIAFNRAFGTDKSFWEFVDQPAEDARLRRFAMCMEGSKNASPPRAIVDGVDWAALGKDALVVDVGGGQGGQSLTLSQNCPNLRFVVQDREAVRDAADRFWEKENPEAWKSGRASFQAHDFFGSQNIKNADVFLLRMIMHDYPDSDCLKILRHLRDAAQPSTQLIVVDNVMAYACAEPGAGEVFGAALPPPPAPLLPNFGEANSIAYLTDIQMMALTGGVERTLTQVQALLKEAGWRVTRVHHGAPFALSHQKVIAVPA